MSSQEQNTSSAVRKPKRTPIALGPDSLAWQYAGDNLQLLIAGTTLVLQVSHPVVGAGVGDHSVFKKDPWGRLQRTTEWGLKLLYGGPVNAPQSGQDLRELHRNIKGQDDKGRKYFALDPEAYAWVHMTTYYAMITTQRLFADEPFTPFEQERLLQDWIQQGRILGIRDQDMPQNVAAFWKYFDNMVRERLEVTDTALYLLDVSLSAMRKPPAMRWFPTQWWNGLYRSLGNWAKLATVASMPEELRQKFDLAWDEPAQKRFQRLQKVVRATAPHLPMRLRYLPPAYHALKGSYNPELSRQARAV